MGILDGIPFIFEGNLGISGTLLQVLDPALGELRHLRSQHVTFCYAVCVYERVEV